MRSSAILLAALLAVGASAAQAGDATVVVREKMFSPDVITVKKGQTITFSNQDPVVHNIYSETPGMEFSSRIKATGDKVDIKFDAVGEAVVECTDHASMNLTVKVVP